MAGALRLDSALVARGLCASRTAAQKAIDQGRVHIFRLGHSKPELAAKPSQTISELDRLELVPDEADRYVSRGALKMLGALDTCGVSPAGLQCLDVGQSTGGFTDALLHRDALRVLGIDVGHGQLHERLRQDDRTLGLEGVNARDCNRDLLQARLNAGGHDPKTWLPDGGFDLIVMDVSFISLLKVSAALRSVMKSAGHGIWLVKPQFEVGPAGIGKGGIVRPDALGPAFEQHISTSLNEQGYRTRLFFESPILGGDGNTEFFVWVSPES